MLLYIVAGVKVDMMTDEYHASKHAGCSTQKKVEMTSDRIVRNPHLQ